MGWLLLHLDEQLVQGPETALPDLAEPLRPLGDLPERGGVKAAQEALGHKSPRVTLEVDAHETEGSALQIPLEVFQRPVVATADNEKPN